MTTGERILEIIKERGMTQKDFSGLTGIPQSTMSCWKTRKQSPNIEKLQLICDVLDVDLSYLVSGTTDENKKTRDYLCIYNGDLEYELVTEYRKLDYGRKNRLIGYLRALKEEK